MWLTSLSLLFSSRVLVKLISISSVDLLLLKRAEAMINRLNHFDSMSI
ncbi:hypothetical Protein YC6258_04941 [Gynuella sunshinyii YC6258]|uniref:Uncharacterized protein n=1 Tax=Gynuella sunshinyii YC6258 TaxID=1445510 RepID=A0A0C5VQT2_9GAMM|nr:hypothetical Protein YC6258_04941 [Gynuella sunshinyii YC6258]